MMFLYLLFVGTHYYQPVSNGFSNILSPIGIPNLNDVDESNTVIGGFKETIEEIYYKNKILPLLQETEFKQKIIDTLFNGQSSKVSIYKSMTSENWELFKRHLAFDENIILKAFVLDDLPEGQPIEDFYSDIQVKIKSLAKENGGDLEIETNLGIILLNISILLIELYLLFEIVIQIYFSVGKLGGKDEKENTNQVWNIIINSFFALCIFILWIIQLYRW
jgi:hypothetical protein